MEIKRFTYLLLLLVFMVIPVILGTRKRVVFWDKIRYVLPAMVFTGAIYVLWDIRFTALGIRSFNPDYLTGIDLLNLPAEEWLSFFVIPISGIYIYEYLKMWHSGFEKPNLFVAVSLVLLVAFGLLAYFSRQKLFTFFTFFLLAIYFGYTIFRNRFKKHFTKFYLAYFISLIPFVVVSWVSNALPVVVFDSEHILGIGLPGAPVEMFGYLFLLLLMNVTIYEYLKERQFY